MSTIETTDVDDIDLDTFSSEFFGQSSSTPTEKATSEEPVEDENIVDDAPTTEENDTHSEEDALDNDETDDSESEDAEKADPKPKKNRFQERIDELTTARREAERREQALRDEFEALKSEFKTKAAPEINTPVVVNGPTPDDVNEDGSDKYPLGEFDPNYIRDLTRHTLEEERSRFIAEQEKEQERLKALEAETELKTSWNAKLAPAQERYPDFLEKGTKMVDAFENLDPAYSQYLTTTIMSLDYGTDVMYYLANNLDEAKRIVESGAAKATIALGRIEAKFALAEEEKQKARPKVSNAPTPPPFVNKGTSPGKVTVDPDTDDLDAFASVFFKKK